MFCTNSAQASLAAVLDRTVEIMEQASLTSYEASQVALIAAWKARKPGLLRRTVETLKWPVARVFEKVVSADKARTIFARVHQAADWQQGRDVVQRALGINHVKELYDGPLERCDGLVNKVADISRQIITSESLLANAGGVATELLELPAEIMLAMRTVHRVASCYGYPLDRPQDETLVMAVIGLSLVDDPAERQSARRLVRGLEDGSSTKDDQQRLSTISQSRLEDEVGDDLAQEIGATLVEEKVEEGIPLLGAALGVVLDSAFIAGVEEAARFTFQERWLREHGKVDEIGPAVSSQRENAPIVESLGHAVYSTSYAVSFGVVFPVALIGSALSTVLPAAVTDGLNEGAAAATSDVDRLIAGVRGQPDPAQGRA
jgi:EcsC protein family